MRVDSIIAQQLPSLNNNGKKFLNAMDSIEGLQGVKAHDAGSVNISASTSHTSDLVKNMQGKNTNIAMLEVTHNSLSGIRDHALMAGEILNNKDNTLQSTMDIDALMQKISQLSQSATYEGKSVFGSQMTLGEGRYLQIPKVDVPEAQTLSQPQIAQYLKEIDSAMDTISKVSTEQQVALSNQLAALSSNTPISKDALADVSAKLTQQTLQSAHDLDTLAQSAQTLLR